MSEKQIILVVDDNPTTLKLIEESLKKDYEVLTVSNGVDAIEICTNQHVDLILLDVVMPEIDGYEVCKSLKGDEKLREIPIILVSSKGEEIDEIKGFELGAVDYILKPIIPSILKVRIRTQLELKTYRNSLEERIEERMSELYEINTIIWEMKNSILKISEGDDPSIDYFFNNSSIVHCRTLLNCDKKECPAYEKRSNVRCWSIVGTHCRGMVQGDFAQKIGDCAKCEVYQVARQQSHHVLGETFYEMISLLNVWQSKLVEANASLNKEISERSRLEKQEKLMLQDKYSNLEQLAIGLAHEVNQPLTYISAMIQTTIDKLERNKFDPEKMIVKFKKSTDQVARIIILTDHLRALRWSSGEVQYDQVDLSVVLDDLITVMSDKFQLKQNNITLHCQVPENMPTFFGNHNKLEQVFINLISNSRTALQEQGGGEITVSIIPETEQITIRFSDDGCGMSPEVQDKIFEPFFTTKDRGKGAGIGLGIVLDIVAEHKGNIICESEQGKGTTFTIILPIKNSAHEGLKTASVG